MGCVSVIYQGERVGPLLSRITFGELLTALKVQYKADELPSLCQINASSGTDILGNFEVSKSLNSMPNFKESSSTFINVIREPNAYIPTGVYELLTYSEWSQRIIRGELDPSLVVQTHFDTKLEVFKRELAQMKINYSQYERSKSAKKPEPSTVIYLKNSSAPLTSLAQERAVINLREVATELQRATQPLPPPVDLPTKVTAVEQGSEETANAQHKLKDDRESLLLLGLSELETADMPATAKTHFQVSKKLEAAINDMIYLLQDIQGHAPHQPPTPKLHEAVNELLHLTRVLDEVRPKSKPQLSSRLAEIDYFKKTIRQKGWSSIALPPSGQRSSSLPSTLSSRDIDILKTSIKLQNHYDSRIGHTRQSAFGLGGTQPRVLLPEHSPQYTLLLYHTLNGCLQLHKSFLHCPRTTQKYYHVTDVSNFDKLRKAESMLQTYHMWRRLIRLEQPQESLKSPIGSYKTFPVLLFRHALSLTHPPLELGLGAGKKLRMPSPTRESMYQEFKCSFIEAWTQCRVSGDGELVVLLDLLLQQKKLEFEALHHSCYRKWVYPTAYLRDRVRFDFDITFGRDDQITKVIEMNVIE